MSSDVLSREWLAAAAGGGLPEPVRSRWQPLRVGVVNLWEYDNAEFWFADGRLVLRGGNGAGKTKVLELTTLMLLRGEIGASVLDPFGSQHRTMRFNLLPTGEGDDPRPPADSGLGYAWAEFGRRDDDGSARYFVCGMGASARRGTGTTTPTVWHFVTALRPGKDLSLTSAGRPIDQKDLKNIDGVSVPGSAGAYRARLAAELFALSDESYDNLTELLKQLRRPKLGERLNPARLAETLSEALPPLATHEITQLAEGWEHLEQLRAAVEETEHAATEVARFARAGWRPWARAVLRARADAMAKATTVLDNTTRDKREAEGSLATARERAGAAEQELRDTTRRKQDLDTELREVLESAAYQDAVGAAARVEQLRHSVVSVDRQRGSAQDRSERACNDLSRARQRALDDRSKAAQAAAKVAASAEALRDAARPAGLAGSVETHLSKPDLDALASDYQARLERFGQLRVLSAEHARTDREVDRSAKEVQRSEQERAKAEEEQQAAHGMVERQVEDLRQAIRGWATTATVARCTDDLAGEWSDGVSELTVIDAASGAAVPGASVVEMMRRHVAAARAALGRRAERLRVARAPLAARRDGVTEELAKVRSAAETTPPSPELWARRDRPDLNAGQGAPLWRLVNPADGVDAARLARLEAALAASGLLDTWISPDGSVSTVDGSLPADVQPLTAVPRPAASLLAVLSPDTAGGVPAETVRRLLAGIGWFATPSRDNGGDWLAADGSWRIGGLTGRAEPTKPASYLGAAAREAARQRRIAELEHDREILAGQLATINAELTDVEEEGRTLDGEEQAIPTAAERDLTTLVATLGERTRRLAACESVVRDDTARHNTNLQQRDAAWARFAEYASTHRFTLQDLDAQDAALREYGTRLTTLSTDRELLDVRLAAAEEAEADALRREESYRRAADEAEGLDDELRQARVRLATAESVLKTEHADVLGRRERLDGEVQELESRKTSLNDILTNARVAVTTAENTLTRHEEKRAAAEQQRDEVMTALWAAVDAGLVAPLGVPVPGRRSVQTAREFTAVVRRDITVGQLAADVDRAWRRCYEQLQQLRHELLPHRDARIDDEDPTGIPQVLVLADPSSGWQSPSEAADVLAGRVEEQQATYDAEQQQVLATLLGSTFIEHLKDRLDYTAHTFARINQQLARHPTRHGHVVRVLCEADPTDPDAGAVVRALSRGYHELSAERQDMVRSFLARKIDEARADASADGAADWKEQLARALDYRHWLRLSLQYRLGGGGAWVVFDSAKHGAKSGGEKVVLLSQPLFAAAVVAYDAAGPHAPRWVWLDEAMTGVDAEVKASFMGLTVDFQLDIMLTAHDEWCTYPTVPAVAIYDLARQPLLPGVDAMPYLWCGGQLTAVDAATAPAPDEIPSDGLLALLPEAAAGE